MTALKEEYRYCLELLGSLRARAIDAITIRAKAVPTRKFKEPVKVKYKSMNKEYTLEATELLYRNNAVYILRSQENALPIDMLSTVNLLDVLEYLDNNPIEP